MAFSSVRKVLPQHLAGIVLENVVIHNIFFYFILVLDVYFTLYFVVLCFISFISL